MKKTNMKTGIIAAILVIVTVTSIAAFTTATASAAETAVKATAAQSDNDIPDIFKKLIDIVGNNTNEPKPDTVKSKDLITVKTQNGEKEYGSFKEAWAQAVKEKNASIKLKANQTEIMHLTVPAGVKINVDLNGFTIEAQGDLFTVEAGGELRVSNGSLTETVSAVTANGPVYLDKVTFKGAISTAVNVAKGAKAVITDCTFENNRGARGGAICVPGNVQGSKIVNCTFIHNFAYKEGGAVYTSTPIIGCTFKDNESEGNGGAVYYGHSIDSIRSCTFEKNHAMGNGGALYVIAHNELNGNTFIGNKADKDGGAIYIPDQTDEDVLYSKFFNNEAGGSGGAIYAGEFSPLRAYTLTVTGNTAGNKGGGIYLGALRISDHRFGYVTVTDNTAAVGGGVYCDAGCAKAADVDLIQSNVVKDNTNSNFYLVKNCGKKAVLSTTKSFLYKDSCIYVNSSESGERAVVSLEEKCHEYAFHGDDGRALERGNLHNYTLYIQ